MNLGSAVWHKIHGFGKVSDNWNPGKGATREILIEWEDYSRSWELVTGVLSADEAMHLGAIPRNPKNFPFDRAAYLERTANY